MLATVSQINTSAALRGEETGIQLKACVQECVEYGLIDAVITKPSMAALGGM